MSTQRDKDSSHRVHGQAAEMSRADVVLNGLIGATILVTVIGIMVFFVHWIVPPSQAMEPGKLVATIDEVPLWSAKALLYNRIPYFVIRTREGFIVVQRRCPRSEFCSLTWNEASRRLQCRLHRIALDPGSAPGGGNSADQLEIRVYGEKLYLVARKPVRATR